MIRIRFVKTFKVIIKIFSKGKEKKRNENELFLSQ